MTWSCLICGWRQLDGTQPPQHTCGHASNAFFAIPDGHVSPMIAFDPQPSPTFNSTTRIPFIATQHSPRPSMWLTDRYTDPVPPIVQASTDQSPFHDGFQSQGTTFRYPQPEPLQTSHEEHVSRRVGQTLRSPAFSTQVPSDQVKCEWASCTYDGFFSRDMSLWRHIKDKHILSTRFKCGICHKAFGRPDKLQGHMRDAHPKPKHGNGHCSQCSD